VAGCPANPQILWEIPFPENSLPQADRILDEKRLLEGWEME